ncbi:MAG TPA: glucose dehydrogenase [Dongiaceae bacterium]|nr:glucose dehydrogenase [Dongiaceae bacterium]
MLKPASLLVLVLALVLAPPAVAKSPYPLAGKCGGLPQIPVMTADGFCLALVAYGLKFPRGILALGNDRFLVADMGGFGAPGAGRIWQFDRAGTVFKGTVVLRNLDRPHGLELGPDGKVYVGVVGGVKRFEPGDPAGTVHDVIGGLAQIAGPPGDGLHPLVSLLFTSRKTLLVNGGSFTNNCEGPKGELPPQGAACPETRAPNAHGVLWEYSFDWKSGTATGVTILAEGLRNSLGLLETKQGVLLQAENSRDGIADLMPELPDDEDLPPDEINVLEPGAHYGWPYCYGANIASPDYPSFDCSGMKKPLIELPGHAAPLSMAWFDGGLIVAYHGFRTNGHRIVRFALNADGLPEGKSRDLVAGWDGRDTGPQGAPVDLEPLPNGDLLISEDRNGTILLLTRGK